ncbi:hypothetical protein Droror1_Dr00000072, partial [Drosera rotundifolia]
CGSLCFFYPSMRSIGCIGNPNSMRVRSKQLVKRYKKMIVDIFPKSPDREPNDRKIGKLCEYVSKNPLCIPKELYF